MRMRKMNKEVSGEGKKNLLCNFKVHKWCVFGEQKAKCLMKSSLWRRVGEVAHAMHGALVQ